MIAPIPSMPGGWPVVLADPAWSFSDRAGRGAAARHYSTMTRAAICALPVLELVAPDALLFLWTTSAHLLDGSAADVCFSWGFTPKTTIAWVKCRSRPLATVPRFNGNPGKAGLLIEALHIGCGHYTRAAHELLVIARRGKARVARRDVPSVIFAPRGRHSAKPAESYEAIERLTPDRPRLELFARGLPRPGWTGWGNEFGLEAA